jgi:signal transduction histidine kinase
MRRPSSFLLAFCLLGAGGVALGIVGFRHVRLQAERAEGRSLEDARAAMAQLSDEALVNARRPVGDLTAGRGHLAWSSGPVVPLVLTWEVRRGEPLPSALDGIPEAEALRVSEAEFAAAAQRDRARAITIYEDLAVRGSRDSLRALATVRAAALHLQAGASDRARVLLEAVPEGEWGSDPRGTDLHAMHAYLGARFSSAHVGAFLGTVGRGFVLDMRHPVAADALLGTLLASPPPDLTRQDRAALDFSLQVRRLGLALADALDGRRARGGRFDVTPATAPGRPALALARWVSDARERLELIDARLLLPDDLPPALVEATVLAADRVDPKTGLVLALRGDLQDLVLQATPRPPEVSGVGAVLLGLSIYLLGMLLSMYALRRAQRVARQQSEFVAAVSHEMKTPIASVRAMAEFLEGEPDLPDRPREYAARMGREMERLGRTVGNVLDVARIERQGRLVLSRKEARPDEVVRRIAESVRPAIEARGLELEVDVPESEAQVVLDEDALRGALGNLLDNAAKFGGSGGLVRLTGAANGQTYRIAVEDRGAGVPEKEQGMIFERFARGRGAKAGAVPGVGLGLHVVRAVARAHGGRVFVETPEAGGARFVMELPREDKA